MAPSVLNQIGLMKKAGLFLMASLLFWEVLNPLSEITNTERLGIFFIGFVLFLFLNVSCLTVWVRVPIKLLIIYFLINAIFYPDLLFRASDWHTQLFVALDEEWKQMGEVSFLAVPAPVTRSVCFFLTLWMLSKPWAWWFLSRNLIYIPFLLVFLYLQVLDIATDYDAGGTTVRVVIYAICCFSWIQWQKLLFRLPALDKAPKGWIGWTALLLILVISLGVTLPKIHAAEGRTFSILSGDGGGEGQGAFAGKRIGYSRDDSNLGGPLILDEKVVFQAKTDELYYWRGESKSGYTGRGWIREEYGYSDQSRDTMKRVDNGWVEIQEDRAFYNLFYQTRVKKNRVEVRWINPMYTTMFVPGQLRRAYQIDGQEPLGKFDFVTQWSFTTYIRSLTGKKFRQYSMETEIPVVDEEKLRKGMSTVRDGSYLGVNQSTILPDTVPKRVSDLAVTVTRKAKNPYDKVKAVESFLKDGHFRYETRDVPPLPEGQDFVDHFLFETKRGYCDHFSSAMVVMLRSVGIPARWVKGFAEGESRFNGKTQRYDVTVRNKDAHAWVEVYFTGVGWIPFDPTPTFSVPASLDHSLDTSQTNRNQTGSPAATNQQASLLEKRLERQETQDQELTGATGEASSGQNSEWKWVLLYIAVTGVVLTLAVRMLRRKAGWWMLHRYRRTGNNQSFIKAYQSLMKWVQHKRGKRRPDQTLREYWHSSEWTSLSKEAITLTKLYEEARYGKNEKRQNYWVQAWKYWKMILKQLRP
ncbi:DUF4129 domain-containing transglutaminase family protein [Paenactinomyces guangxiensis]|uniref:Transglutaminase domain-containing protein n=1 Tax=Paenactinomyces guangxiensis TaxID=1490290 RepID=A0A7W1WT45_9BACL|nr:transglutaminase domain-containing protein [Paenactinomyces guangxiensis]MBA4495593.1 transglutaminase domain-containing protein [Paenactinomyces guangxiensis]MBH8592851.1 transglutaminase domain-containing protein [Paenactinomyces guangxiensis]